MSTLELEFYDAVKTKLGEKESRMLLELLEAKVGREFTKQSNGLAMQADIANLKAEMQTDIANLKAEMQTDIANLKAEMQTDIANLKAEMQTDIANLKAEMQTDIANLKAEMQTDIANFKAEIIKWMFIFWIGAVGTILGSLIGIFKLAGIL